MTCDPYHLRNVGFWI